MKLSNEVKNWCVLTIKGGKIWVSDAQRKYLVEDAEMGKMVTVNGQSFAVHQIAEIIPFHEYMERFPKEFRRETKEFEPEPDPDWSSEKRRRAFRDMARGFRTFLGGRESDEWQARMLRKMERYADMENPPIPLPSAVYEHR